MVDRERVLAMLGTLACVLDVGLYVLVAAKLGTPRDNQQILQMLG